MFHETAASDTILKYQSPQIEVNPGVNYTLIDSDEDSEDTEEFVNNSVRPDVSMNSKETPDFGIEIVEEVPQQICQDGFEMLAKVATDVSEERNVVKTIFLWKGESFAPKKTIKTPHFPFGWVDILN